MRARTHPKLLYTDNHTRTRVVYWAGNIIDGTHTHTRTHTRTGSSPGSPRSVSDTPKCRQTLRRRAASELTADCSAGKQPSQPQPHSRWRAHTGGQAEPECPNARVCFGSERPGRPPLAAPSRPGAHRRAAAPQPRPFTQRWFARAQHRPPVVCPPARPSARAAFSLALLRAPRRVAVRMSEIP